MNQNHLPWPLFRGRLRSREPSVTCHIRHWISRKQLETEPWFKGPSIMAYGGIKWSCDRWRHVSDPERSSCDPNTHRVKYRENSWRCYWATIANYWIVCCDVERSAILATAWLLVDNLQRQTFSHSQLHISFSVFCPISAKKWKKMWYSFLM